MLGYKKLYYEEAEKSYKLQKSIIVFKLENEKLRRDNELLKRELKWRKERLRSIQKEANAIYIDKKILKFEG